MDTLPHRFWSVVTVLTLWLTAPVSGTHASTDAAPLTVHFIDVGQGDSCWLHLPDGDDILVDGGKPQAGPTVVAFLSGHRVTDIELMVATHGDADHIGGLLDVLASIPVGEAWLDSQTCTTGTCLDFYQALADHGWSRLRSEWVRAMSGEKSPHWCSTRPSHCMPTRMRTRWCCACGMETSTSC